MSDSNPQSRLHGQQSDGRIKVQGGASVPRTPPLPPKGSNDSKGPEATSKTETPKADK